MAAPGIDAWSFHCTACGKCCNSPPQMSVPELFHHQRRFIGCISIRAGAGDVVLATQAFAASPSEGCPALGHDMRCTIHDDRKPAACRVVPLDARVPDRLQHLVLAERRVEASYLGADCIVPGARPGAIPLTRGLAVVDPEAREALARRRRDLAADKRLWGDAVFEMLRRELEGDAGALSRIPPGGTLVLAIAPVLMVLASASPRSRGRCLDYLDAQIAVIEEQIRRGTGASAQLRAFLRTNQALRGVLGRAATRTTPGRENEVEAWMGLAGPP